MNTPILDFLKSYAEQGTVRLHMPGHKGIGVLGVEKYDLTEIGGADVLYSSSGIIRESEENAAELFGSARTVYSTEGSTLSIRAMLYLACLFARERGKKPHILAARNAHKSFMNTAAMLDFDVTWLSSDGDCIWSSEGISKEAAEAAISKMPEPPTALYITSPDYLGNTCDIAALSEVCKKYGVLLLVDNAHGAYLRFFDTSRHPINLGADMCADSAHKTLGVLTGGSYLHISKDADTMFSENAERAMALFASTSPSYLILASLDAANAELAGGYRERLASFVAELDKLKNELSQNGAALIGNEPLKLTLSTKPFGYTGEEFAAELEKRGIVCEFADPDFVVLMFTPENGGEAIARLELALSEIPRRLEIWGSAPNFSAPSRAMSIREAMLAPSEVISAENALGRVLADAGVSCPPAIPIAVCGEVIGEAEISLFKYYGIDSVRVLK